MFETVDIESLLMLLTVRTKKELDACARDSVIHSRDFASLILACEAGVMPWTHQIFIHERTPHHLTLTAKDHAVMSSAKVGPFNKETKKVANKIFQVFEERRLLVGHIFYNDDLSDWHFFYFDQRDQDEERNHWQHGPHIHFVNVLWRHLDPETVWEQFCTKSDAPGGALHVRYKQRTYVEPSTRTSPPP